jgi:hypothetical protein
MGGGDMPQKNKYKKTPKEDDARGGNGDFSF